MNYRRAYPQVTAVVAAAIIMAAILYREHPVGSWIPVLTLVLLNFATENFAFQLPLSGSVSLSFAVTFSAMLYAGPWAAVLCAIAGSTTIEEFREKKPIASRLYNAGQLALSAGVAGIAYISLGGRPLLEGSISSTPMLPAAVAPVAFFAVNVVLVALFVSRVSGQSMRDILREQGFLSYGGSLVVLALLGLMIAHLLAVDSWLGLGLLVLPFLAARRTFRVYAELTEAYTSTVRSMVTAIEAKDPYTRGHSERVAVYARRLGERLALPHPQLDLLERAALLHDVGKIGIELDTLSSPIQLTAEEVRLIRRHPVLGSELVSDVEFLSDIVPVIRHHHERYDGAGYPDGVAGERIPLLARVMAVADSYDAMTSNRAYRPAMTQEQALTEISRVAGTQLDRDMAMEFVAMLRGSAEEARPDEA